MSGSTYSEKLVKHFFRSFVIYFNKMHFTFIVEEGCNIVPIDSINQIFYCCFVLH